MQNSDLIPRKEVEKMIEKMIIESEKTDIPSTPQFNNMKSFARYELRNLLQELSQIESVNGWIPVTEITGNIQCLFTDFNEYGVGYKFQEDYSGISFIPTHYMPLPPHP